MSSDEKTKTVSLKIKPTVWRLLGLNKLTTGKMRGEIIEELVLLDLQKNPSHYNVNIDSPLVLVEEGEEGEGENDE